jgi:ABC-type branched-subunit amino acid transport system ATPase component
MSTMIRTSQLNGGYGSIPVLRDVNIEVEAGEVVALLGPNGAGKTTTLLTIAGELPPTSGHVELFGHRVAGPLHRRAKAGLSFVTEERSVLMRLSVLDNLRLAKVSPTRAFGLFPELERRAKTRGGDLSGGEQQMLTLARAIGRAPRTLLADELSLGLAPLVVDRLLAAVRNAAAQDGLAVLIVEQHLDKVLPYADRVYVMVRGTIVYSGDIDDFKSRRQQIENSYLGSVALAS